MELDIQEPNTTPQQTENRFTLQEKGKGKELTQFDKPIRKAPFDWQTEYGRQRYKMYVLATEIPGKDDTTKIRCISKALSCFDSLTSIKMHTIKGIKTIIALFGAQEDAQKATIIKLSDNQTIQMKESPIYNETIAKGKTIRAWDIPLNVTPEDVRTIFTKYGEIKSLKMQTIGMWQSANIEYINQEDYDKLKENWAIPFRADLIRIFPFLNTNEIKLERSQFSLKLNNLPPGTTGYDLKEIIQNTHAQTCYIPRNRNYSRKRFAILSFKTSEAKDGAQDTHVTLGNTTLDWHETTTKLCAICASAIHHTKDCNIKASQLQKAQEKKENIQKFGHLYRRYKPTGVSAQIRFTKSTQQFKTKSFAEAVKERKQPIIEPTQLKTNNETSDQPSLKQIMQAIQQLAEEIKQIKTSLNKMDERIGTIEDDRYYYHAEQDQENHENMEETEITENPNKLFSFTKQQTPPPSIQPEADNPFNYQRKRQAHSPAQDLHERQNNLHIQIDNMGNTLQLIADSISHLHQPNNDDTIDNTTSSNTNQ
jgi:hypothetical protein